MKEREKEIKYLLYLKSELIRKTKREIHSLKMELEELNKQKTMRRNKNMGTIIKQSADGIVLSGDNNFDTNLGKVFINNHEITDIDTFFKVAEENTRLLEQVKKQKEVIDRMLNETKETRNILNNNRDDNMLSKSCLLSYLEIVEDLLKEV